MAGIECPHGRPACELWLASVMRIAALKVVCGFYLRPHTTRLPESGSGLQLGV